MELLDWIPLGIVLVDTAGRVCLVNRAAGVLAGREPAECMGLQAREVFRLEGPAGEDAWERVETAPSWASGTPEREGRLTTAKGVEVPVSFTFRRVPDGLLLLFRHQASISWMRRSVAEMVAAVSHELRSPLTSVKGFTATLLKSWERFGEEEKKHMLLTVNSDADRLGRLIQDLLDASRIEAGRLRVVRRPMDPVRAAEEAVERARSQGAEVELEVEVGLPQVRADPDRVSQVLDNLVSNAIRHGGGRVRLRVFRRDGELLYAVSDEGPGIPPEDLGKIFGKFYGRGRGERKLGTGLGLYISRGIAEAHGGRLWAESQLGQGATFYFSLPLGEG